MHAISFVAAILSVAALATARMELPQDLLDNTTRIEFAGFGGHNKGTYAFTSPSGDEFSGPFTRGESRFSVGNDLYVSNKGGSSFSFRDPATGRVTDAACQFKKVTVNIDIVTLDPKKVAYQCDFYSDGQLQEWRLVLGQPKRKGFKQKFLAKDLRAGQASLLGQNVVIESVHDYKDSKLSSQAAVGYLLRSGEKVLAAVELTDVNPGLYVVPGLGETEQMAVLVSALAIAVFRDPAVSALEE